MFKNKKVLHAVATTGLVMLVILLVYLFGQIYTLSRESVVDNTSMEFGRQTRELDYILQQSTSELSLTADMVEDMLRRRKTNREIETYLVAESEKTVAVFEGNVTGVYGYVRGEYVDGTGWVPEADYDPKTRPWYLAAMQANGELVLVDPYVDAQTKNVLMTVSKRLSDGESVVAFDVYLYPLQGQVEKIASQTKTDILMVTEAGYIAAASLKSEIGGYLSETQNDRLQALDAAFQKAGNQDFEFTCDGVTYVVFNKISHGDWRVLAFLKAQDVVMAVNYLYIGFFGVLLFIVTLVCFVVYTINERRKSSEGINRQLQSLADIYMSMYRLDFVRNVYEVRKEDTAIGKLVRASSNQPLEMVCDVMRKLTAGVDGKNPLSYEELSEKMAALGDQQVMTNEWKTLNGWIRERFIVVEQKDGRPQSVLWVLEDIDEEKKREEHLKSEVIRDELTGLYNRKAYEHTLHRYAESRPEQNTVYIAMDVNGLKFANDNYGHMAGDELLIGAADCMRQSFGADNRLYRTGGDEFVAILFVEEAALRTMLADFEAAVAKWQGQCVKKLSISYGYATMAQFPQATMMELAKTADDRMYENKAIYYKTSGIDRRRAR